MIAMACSRCVIIKVLVVSFIARSRHRSIYCHNRQHEVLVLESVKLMLDSSFFIKVEISELEGLFFL